MDETLRGMTDITLKRGGDDLVEVEVVTSPAGHDVMYVHLNGTTVLRICRFDHFHFEDRRQSIEGVET